MLEESLKGDPASIFYFFRFHSTFLIFDMKHMLKIVPDKYEVHLLAHKNTMNTTFTKFRMAAMRSFHCKTGLAFSQVNHTRRQ